MYKKITDIFIMTLFCEKSGNLLCNTHLTKSSLPTNLIIDVQVQAWGITMKQIECKNLIELSKR